MVCGLSRKPKRVGPEPGVSTAKVSTAKAVHYAPARALVKTREELAADDELTELRLLTPEQELATVDAAQHMRDVVEVVEASPAEERAAATNGDGVLWNQYDGRIIGSLLEHTPLIDLEYLVALAAGGGIMPCGRQHVPAAALITEHNLWRLKLWGKRQDKQSLGVLVISWAWLDWYHPDRVGAQLRRLLPFMKAMLASAKEDSPHCTVGVMIDFLCLPQKPFATTEDSVRFGVSLKAISAWYFHKFAYTLLVSKAPAVGVHYSSTPTGTGPRRLLLRGGTQARLVPDRDSSTRGWILPHQAKHAREGHWVRLLDFEAYQGATEFGGSETSGPGTCTEQMKTRLEVSHRIYCDAAFFHDYAVETRSTTRGSTLRNLSLSAREEPW